MWLIFPSKMKTLKVSLDRQRARKREEVLNPKGDTVVIANEYR